jgi:hypothetical protein
VIILGFEAVLGQRGVLSILSTFVTSCSQYGYRLCWLYSVGRSSLILWEGRGICVCFSMASFDLVIPGLILVLTSLSLSSRIKGKIAYWAIAVAVAESRRDVSRANTLLRWRWNHKQRDEGFLKVEWYE